MSRLTEAQVRRKNRYEKNMAATPSAFAELEAINAELKRRQREQRLNGSIQATSTITNSIDITVGERVLLPDSNGNGSSDHVDMPFDIVHENGGALVFDFSQARRENPNKFELRAKLGDLVADQRVDDQKNEGKFPGVINDPDILVQVYQRDPRIVTIAEALRKPATYDNFSHVDRRRRALSRMLEIIAYDQELRGHSDPEEGVTVLNSERTLAFYQSRFPQASVIQHEFGLGGLSGISIPDYLVVDNNAVQAKIEVTSHKEMEYFDAKYDVFTKDRRRQPALFGNATLVFLVPNNFPKFLSQEVLQRLDDPYVMFAILENIHQLHVEQILDLALANQQKGYPLEAN
jgi:hypothetical protein